MNCSRWKNGLLMLALLACCQCGELKRDNPLDPAADEMAKEGSALSLYLPLPKPLIGVIHRVVATLEGPEIVPVVKELALTPLGPAVGTLGTLQPGEGRSLTLEGFDLEGNLIFSGHQADISIVPGDTTQVEIRLELTVPLPPDSGDGGEEPVDGGTGTEGGTVEGGSGTDSGGAGGDGSTDGSDGTDSGTVDGGAGADSSSVDGGGSLDGSGAGTDGGSGADAVVDSTGNGGESVDTGTSGATGGGDATAGGEATGG